MSQPRKTDEIFVWSIGLVISIAYVTPVFKVNFPLTDIGHTVIKDAWLMLIVMLYTNKFFIDTVILSKYKNPCLDGGDQGSFEVTMDKTDETLCSEILSSEGKE